MGVAIWCESCQPVSAAEVRDGKPLEWRVLLIVKAAGDIEAEGFPRVQYKMAPADIAAVKSAFTEYTPVFVETLSRGKLLWKPEVVVSSTPLTKVARLGDGAWVGPECVADDIEKHAPLGKFDGVFVYWKSTDDTQKRDLNGGFGWSIGPNEAASGGGYTCVNFVPAGGFGRQSEATEVFLHEWLHQLEAFYGSKGVRLPRGGLHGNDNYGFKHQNGWKHWYDAFINANLREQDGTRVGLGEAAWQHGTIRDELAVRLPAFLTAERRKSNLLADGSFEAGGHAWSPRSWRGNQNVSTIDDHAGKSGKAAVVLRAPAADDAMMLQKVAVKPNTQYLLSGWARTTQVVVEEKGGSIGATLSILGTFEASRSLLGTTDWTYLTVQFDAGTRTEVEVGGRLGHHGSTASGTAWFDDLVLIELPQQKPVDGKK
jgi:hypothetical protein